MITTAKQSGRQVFVYGAGGRHLFTKDGELVGFTPSTVTVRGGNQYITYDDRGRHLFTK